MAAKKLMVSPDRRTILSSLNSRDGVVKVVLPNSLATGLKKRLSLYVREINRMAGDQHVLFDDKLRDVYLQYSKQPKVLNSVVGYLNGLTDVDGYKFSRNLRQPLKIVDTLKAFSREDHTSFRWNENYQKSLKDLSKQFEFKVRPLVYQSDDDIRNALPKSDTHSGYTYLETGKRSKGSNVDGALNNFKQMVVKALGVGTMNRPNLIAYRTQASGEFDHMGKQTDVCKHKTRMVSMVDFYVILNELQFSKPIQNRLSEMNFYAGGKNDNQIGNLVGALRANGSHYFSLDYSNYDQSVSSWLIYDCFSILRNCFIMSKEQESLYGVVVHDFINKVFLIGNQFGVKSSKGIPSGSMFTQIIGSMVNYLIIKTYLHSIGVKGDMITMGDDNLCYYQSSPISITSLASYISKNFGMIVNVDKTTVGSWKDNPEFLSRFWGPTGPYRHINHLLSRMLYPERWRDYNKVDPVLVLYSYYLISKPTMYFHLDVVKLKRDYPSLDELVEKVDSRYMPGSINYIKEYVA